MKQSSRGFTMVELLISMGILMVLMTILMRVFLQVVEMRLSAEAESAVSQDARYIYSRLTSDVNQASAILLPSNPGDSGSILRLTIGGVTQTYSLQSGTLVVDSGSGAIRLNSSGTRISSITFTRLGVAGSTNSVKVTWTIESTTERESGPVTKTITTTLGAR